MRWRPMLCTCVTAAMLFEISELRSTTPLYAASVNLALQVGRAVSVSVQPAARVEIVLVSAGADNKVLATTDQNGIGRFDGSALANLGTLTISEETCANRRRVLLVAYSAKAPLNRECSTTQIGTFVPGKDVALNARLSGSFTPAIEAKAIPEPTQATAPPVPVQRAQASTPAQAPRPPITVAGAGARPCPPGASMVGAKLDLATDGDTFEKAPQLMPCAYRGVEDTEPDRWKFYKVQIEKGQTLKVTARLRDADLPKRPYSNFSYGDLLFVRVHDSNGGQVGDTKSIGEPSRSVQLEYKAQESGVAFVSMRWAIRDAAFLISIQ